MADTLFLNARGAEVKALHATLANLDYTIPASEKDGGIYGVATRNAVMLFQRGAGLRPTGEVNAKTANALQEAAARAVVGTHRIEGRVYFNTGTAAPAAKLTCFNLPLKSEEKEVDRIEADANGYYALEFNPKKYARIDLRWQDKAEKWHVLAPSLDPRRKHTELDLVLPVAPAVLKPERERILEDLGKALGTAVTDATIERLGALKETAEKKELTMLHGSTGWDGRLIALSARAAANSAVTKLSQQSLYGLSRVGLPTSVTELAKLDGATVEAALTKAVKHGIIDMDQAAMKAEREKFTEFAVDHQLGSKVGGALSNAKDMLQVSGLSNAKIKAFREVLKTTAGNAEELWSALEAKGFSGAEIGKLQVQGKLAFLTFNNAKLSSSLQASLGTAGVEGLVPMGLYTDEAWEAQLNNMVAAGTAVKELVPPMIPGKDDAERVKNYARELGRKVRISYPTQVAVQRVKQGELRFGTDHDDVKQPFLDLLGRAEKHGFEIGRTAIGPFLKKHEANLFTTSAERAVKEKALDAVKRFNRLYQITPNDDALKVLLENGVKSALDVVKVSEPVFVQRYTATLGKEVAAKVYRKARQVHSTAYGIYRSAKQVETHVSTTAMGQGEKKDSQAKKDAKDALVKKYPTLEQLFGSLDFCECEHCRSVLSPAAYLVDLLQFIQLEGDDWSSFQEHWRDTHPGSGGAAPEEYTDTYAKPFDALIERRPDLAHIPLTCENTHTAMPYIDVVLEIMEYYVAHGALAAETARDTGEATSEELIAEPQYIVQGAYDELMKHRFRPGLPFDLWSETTRAFIDHFDLPLWKVQEIFRRTDKLFDGSTSYDLQDVFAEQLDLSEQELLCFTDPGKLNEWHAYYGYPDVAAARAGVKGAKELSRRLGITYLELYDLLNTRFINPRSHELEVLHRLNSSPAEIFSYYGRAGYPVHPDPEGFSNELAAISSKAIDAPSWVKNAYDQGRFDDILVLQDQQAGCDMSTTALQRADRTDADDLCFVRLALFVRLWRKLSWTIREVDDALFCFFPKATDPITNEVLADVGSFDKLADGFATALIGIAHMEVLSKRFKAGKPGRVKWLSLWGDLPSHGKKDQETGEHHLYGHLFLSPATVQQDPDLDDPSGNYLSAGLQMIEASGTDHTSALQAGVGMNVEDIDLVLDSKKLRRAAALATDGSDAGYALAKLDMSTVSMLYRHGFLARMLKLSVKDLLSFIQLSGIDPFPTLQNTKLTTIEEDKVFNGTLPFIELVLRAKALKMKAEELEFWCRHRYDEAGSFALDMAQEQALFRQLVSAVRQATDAATVEAPLDTSALLDQLTALCIAHLGSDPALTRYLLSTAALLNDPTETVPAGTVPTKPLTERINALAAAGMRQEGFTNADLSGALPVQDLDLSAALQVKQADALGSVRWTCAFEVRDSGDYTFRIDPRKDGGTLAGVVGTLTAQPVDDAASVMGLSSTSTDTSAIGITISLEAGRFYFLELTLQNMVQCAAIPQVEGPAFGLGPIDQLICYPVDAMAAMETASAMLVRVRKALQIASALKLSEKELGWLCSAANADHRLDLNALPVTTDDGGDALARSVFVGVRGLMDHAHLRAGLNVSDDALIDLVMMAQGTASASPADVERAELRMACIEAFAAITRRTAEDVTAIVENLGIPVGPATLAGSSFTFLDPVFRERALLIRLWECMQAVSAVGVSLEVLMRAIRPDRDATSALDLRNAVKACYEPDAWRRAAGPVFDRLRKKQRDALVAYLLHKLGLERREQLYEHFLVDPGMEPVVLTSRIRLATATVQTFIHRCLLNLESKVHPSAITKPDEWKWKKRYRVWEANRKIFLFPENWLEPEWRDDKSHLFRELESAIFQTDLTAETAETAYFNYLRKLEEIAKLDVVTTYEEEVAGAPDQNSVHVIGRTGNLPHKYFYRKYQFGEWTPWEPIDAEIEGDHVVTAIWKGRLYVFWLTFLEKADMDGREDLTIEESKDLEIGGKQSRHVEIQLNWTERSQGQWQPRAASGFGPAIKVRLSSDVTNEEIQISTSSVEVNGVESLKVNVHFPKLVFSVKKHPKAPSLLVFETPTPQTSSFQLISKLVPPRITKRSISGPDSPFNTDTLGTTKEWGSGTLNLNFAMETREEADGTSSDSIAVVKVLEKGDDYSLVFPSAPLEDVDAKLAPWLARFFYADDEHLFFVEPGIKETTTAEWEGWVVTQPKPGRIFEIPRVIEEIPVAPGVPWTDPVRPDLADSRLSQLINPRPDWLNDDRAVVLLGDQVIGRSGSVPVSELVLEGALNERSLSSAIGRAGTTDVLNAGSAGSVSSPGTAHLGNVVIGDRGLLGHVLADVAGRRTEVPFSMGRSNRSILNR